MNKRLRIKEIDVFSIVVFFACVEIPSLTRHHGQNYLFLARFLIFLLLFIDLLFEKNKIKINFFKTIISLITLWFIYLLLITYVNGKNLIYAFRIVSIPYTMVLYIYRYKEKMIQILNCWCFLLAVLVSIDFITIILFPQGMYNDGLYNLNWFLGYKTARFQIELPLCVISGYLSKIKDDKINLRTYIFIIISMICTLKAETTSAFVCLILLFLLFLFLNIGEKIKNGKRFLYRLFDYKIIIGLYILTAICLISINSLTFVQKIVVNILHKDATLTTRTYIWQMMLKKIVQKPFWGYGILNQETYISITNSPYANSAHSIILGLLIEGGIVGGLLYFFILVKALNRKFTQFLEADLILVAGVIVMLIVGLISVSLLYCEFSMVIYAVLYLNTDFFTGGLYGPKKI